MADLFAPCLQASATGDFNQWKQLHHFGEPMPASLGNDPNSLLMYSLLEANNLNEAGLRAVVAGKLSTSPSDDFLRSLKAIPYIYLFAMALTKPLTHR